GCPSSGRHHCCPCPQPGAVGLPRSCAWTISLWASAFSLDVAWSLCPRNTGARLGFPRRRPTPPDGQAQLVRACPLSPGLAVRFEPECVSGFDRNHCSDSTGLHTCTEVHVASPGGGAAREA